MLTCPQCHGEFYINTPGMNCPNCNVWMEGENFSPSKGGVLEPTKEPTEEERATLTAEGARFLATHNQASQPDYLYVSGHSGDPALESGVLNVLSKAYLLWQERQKKYGRSNIARTGALGCYIRAEDKMARLRGTYIQRKGDMPDESISDTWLDLLNYAMMGYMCHHKMWPGLEGANWYGESNALPPSKLPTKPRN